MAARSVVVVVFSTRWRAMAGGHPRFVSQASRSCGVPSLRCRRLAHLIHVAEPAHGMGPSIRPVDAPRTGLAPGEEENEEEKEEEEKEEEEEEDENDEEESDDEEEDAEEEEEEDDDDDEVEEEEKDEDEDEDDLEWL